MFIESFCKVYLLSYQLYVLLIISQIMVASFLNLRPGQEVSKGAHLKLQRFGVEPQWGAVVKSWWGLGAKSQEKLYKKLLGSNSPGWNGQILHNPAERLS